MPNTDTFRGVASTDERSLFRSDNIDSYLAADRPVAARDGFSHVVLHRNERGAEEVADSFTDIPACLSRTTTYRFTGLTGPEAIHAKTSIARPTRISFLPGLKHSCILHLTSHAAMLLWFIYSPAQDLAAISATIIMKMCSEWKDLIHIVHDERGAATVTYPQQENTDLDSITTQNNVFLLIYNPQVSDPRSESEYATWMAQNLKSCQLKFSSEDMIVEYLIDRDYPCELIVAETALEVRYDNGITLANLLADWDGDQLSIDSWWQRGKYRGYAYTIQVFNEQGEKQLQIDQVIDSRPLSHAQIDTSSLEPGDYVAKLIVYDKEYRPEPERHHSEHSTDRRTRIGDRALLRFRLSQGTNATYKPAAFVILGLSPPAHQRWPAE